MSMAELMISDYSSIATDFLLTHRPVIYLFSDYDEYNDSRGFSFEPIQSVCCGDVVYTWNDMKKALQRAISNSYEMNDVEKQIFRMWYKYDDYSATQRCYDLLCGILE